MKITLQMWLCAGGMLAAFAGCTPAPVAMVTSTQASADMETKPSVTAVALDTVAPTETPMPFDLRSPDFEEGGTIPRDFACTGANKSPQLDWGEPPAGTQSFAIIFDDPDASSKGFIHWVVYNIPGKWRSVPAEVPPGSLVQDGAVHGSNGWGRMDYGGPCPPEGSTHNYVFTLYALDVMLDLEPGATKEDLLARLEGHVLAETSLSASFTR